MCPHVFCKLNAIFFWHVNVDEYQVNIGSLPVNVTDGFFDIGKRFYNGISVI